MHPSPQLAAIEMNVNIVRFLNLLWSASFSATTAIGVNTLYEEHRNMLNHRVKHAENYLSTLLCSHTCTNLHYYWYHTLHNKVLPVLNTDFVHGEYKYLVLLVSWVISHAHTTKFPLM